MLMIIPGTVVLNRNQNPYNDSTDFVVPVLFYGHVGICGASRRLVLQLQLIVKGTWNKPVF